MTVKQKILDTLAKLPTSNPTQRNIVSSLTERVNACSWQIEPNKDTVGVAINLFREKSGDNERLSLALTKFKDYLSPLLALSGETINSYRIYVNVGIWRNCIRLVIQLRKATQRRKSNIDIDIDEL